MENSDQHLTILKEEKIGHGLIQLRDDNILFFKPDLANFKEYNLEVLKDLHEAFVNITDGIPRPYLCDNRYITGIVNKKEMEFMNAHFGDFATKAAMITNSSVIRVLVNTYHSVFKPKVIVKLFQDEKSAVQWLLT